MMIIIHFQKETFLDCKLQLMLHVGFGYPWIVANHPSYIQFMEEVLIKYVKRTTRKEAQQMQYGPFDFPLQNVYRYATDSIYFTVQFKNGSRELSFRPKY